MPVGKSITIPSVKEDVLLQSWVQFLALGGLEDFAARWSSQTMVFMTALAFRSQVCLAERCR